MNNRELHNPDIETAANSRIGGLEKILKWKKSFKWAIVAAAAPFLASPALNGCGDDFTTSGGVTKTDAGMDTGNDGDTYVPDTCVPTGEEICDGVDNDCDGETDDGLTPPACEKTKGVCENPVALPTCNGPEGWSKCNYGPYYQEGEEQTCDGLDNDCDNEIDEPEDLGKHTPACPLTEGVCEGSTSKRVCENGNWSSCDDAYGPDYEPVEESCDGLDNDCDTVTDGRCVVTKSGSGLYEQLVNQDGVTFNPIDGSTGDASCESIDTTCMSQAGNVQVVWKFSGNSVTLKTDTPPLTAEMGCSVESTSSCPTNQQLWDDFVGITDVSTVVPTQDGDEYTYVSPKSCLRHVGIFTY